MTTTDTNPAPRPPMDRRPWADIIADFKMVGEGGTRMVLMMDEVTGATVLAPWVGPGK